jgi:hypothetical protein
MKLAVVGSRDFKDEYLFKYWLEKYLFRFDNLEIVSGGAKGADTMAENFAAYHGLKLKVFPALWSVHGKSAGFKRNADIWDYADMGIAFWDGESKGTKHSLELASERMKYLQVVWFMK